MKGKKETDKPKHPKFSTMIVRFQQVAESQIWDFLDSMNCRGTCVSTFLNRWAIEVPFGKESEVAKKMNENTSLVVQVHPFAKAS